MPSVKQCASKRNSSRVNSAYMDSTIKEYLKEYYCFLWITPMNLDKPMRYHRNNTEDRRHPNEQHHGVADRPEHFLYL